MNICRLFQLCQHDLKSELGNLDFSTKAGREDTLKLTIGKYSLHKISNIDGFKITNFATSGTVFSKNAVVPDQNIYKCTLT
jgi:hypothetical protein